VGEGALQVKELAQAISALINASPRTPWVEEIEAVIRQHMPEAPDGRWAIIVPQHAAEGLAKLARESMKLGPRVPIDQSVLQGLDAQTIIIYLHPLLLIDPRDDQRNIAGILMRSRRLHIVWYDEEMDSIGFTLISPWYAAKAVVPAQYAALMEAWHKLKQARVTP
jgi:hypothetical protein